MIASFYNHNEELGYEEIDGPPDFEKTSIIEIKDMSSITVFYHESIVSNLEIKIKELQKAINFYKTELENTGL